MKNKFSRLFTGSLAIMVLACAAIAQNNGIASAAGDKYVISAKAGGVNFVEGAVSIAKQEGRSGILLKGDRLEIGDRVSTGADGKVEILLNPGSFLRLGGNSSFEFKTTSLDDLQVNVQAGSAIFEVFAAEDFTVSVNVPNTKFHLIQSGIYRVDVSKDGTGTIEVWKGKAELADAKGTVVKGGREASLAGGNAAIAKFDRDDKDDLETWSKARSKALAKTSASLDRRQMRTSLMHSFLGRQWNMYDSFGLWVFDPLGLNYCFLPFGYGWQSPYGYGFGNHIGWYNLPPVVYYPPSTVTPNNTGRRGNGTRAVPSPDSARTSRRDEVPPFVRIQGNTSSRVGVRQSPLPSFDDERGPVYSPPVRIAPPISNSSAKPSRP
ncbi:MAG: FecR domain-containing protein [Saprospiraceae bacterium]|nr:FecR domain-containing protein [Pyrinomonadaceae bacterium]